MYRLDMYSGASLLRALYMNKPLLYDSCLCRLIIISFNFSSGEREREGGGSGGGGGRAGKQAGRNTVYLMRHNLGHR